MKKLSTLKIEALVYFIVNTLVDQDVTFKCETYLSTHEDKTINPKDGKFGEESDAWDFIHDESENERYDCQLLIPSDATSELVETLQKKFGAPTEMREEHEVEKKNPVWKFGRKGKGQLWIYPHGEKTYVDVRYYYEKV